MSAYQAVQAVDNQGDRFGPVSFLDQGDGSIFVCHEMQSGEQIAERRVIRHEGRVYIADGVLTLMDGRS